MVALGAVWRRPLPALHALRHLTGAADAILAAGFTVAFLLASLGGERPGPAVIFPPTTDPFVGEGQPGPGDVFRPMAPDPFAFVASYPTPTPTPWPLLPFVTLPLAWRRRLPLTAFLTQFVAIELAQPSAGGTIAFVAVVLGAYSAAAHSPYRFRTLAGIVGVAGVVAATGQDAMPDIPEWAGAFFVLVPLGLAGNAVRSWRERADVSEERARLLERERQAALRQAVYEERTRIARELHDVVSHSVSVMVVQAGAARQVVRRDTEQAREAMLAVEASGREALTELRHLLGLLTSDGDDADAGYAGDAGPALAPQPGLGQLPGLVQRLIDAGQPVEVEVAGSPRPLPPGVDLTAFRVVQEALTNSLRYAHGSRTRVVVDFGVQDLRLEVCDDGRDPAGPQGAAVSEGAAVPEDAGNGAGRGLIGLAERVSLYGGAIESGKRPGGGYRVRARIPAGTGEAPA